MNKKTDDIIDKVSPIVNAIGSVASVFFPKISAPVVLASKVLDQIQNINDEDAKNIVFGLSATSNELDLIIDEYNKSGKLDIENLKILSENIKGIDKALDKFNNLIS